MNTNWKASLARFDLAASGCWIEAAIRKRCSHHRASPLHFDAAVSELPACGCGEEFPLVQSKCDLRSEGVDRLFKAQDVFFKGGHVPFVLALVNREKFSAPSHVRHFLRQAFQND